MTNFLQHGLWNMHWWGYVVYTLVLTHITILSVTIYLHRCQAHRALDLHPVISHFFRFWVWATTGMVTKEWAAIHRKHHAFSDKVGDPHSPQVYGIKKVFFEGVELYQEEAKNLETMKKYGAGTPDDWMERNIYTKHSKLGISALLIINLALFGPIGLSIWAIQMLWIPIFAAGTINGIAHFWGYRNFQNPDHAKNIFPIGFLIGGEELHNNHHTFGTSAKLSYKWYEFDIGWMWIRIFEICHLASVKKISPVLHKQKMPKLIPDYQTLDTLIRNRYNLMSSYAKTLKQDCTLELAKIQASLHEKINWNKIKTLLAKDADLLTPKEKGVIQKVVAKSQLFNKLFAMRADIGALWQRSHMSREDLLLALQNWCARAEISGIKKLQLFSLRLKASY